MHPLPHASLRLSTLTLILGAGLATPKAVEEIASQGNAGGGEPAAVHASTAAAAARGPARFRPTPVSPGTPAEKAPRCSVAVDYADEGPVAERVTLTDVEYDRACPADLNTTMGLTFEIDNRKSARNLWWRRAESSFDVLYPSTGAIASAGKSRVSLSNLILDQVVTIEILDGDRRLLSFTLKHF